MSSSSCPYALFSNGCVIFFTHLCLHDVTTDQGWWGHAHTGPSGTYASATDYAAEEALDVVPEEAAVEGDPDAGAENENPATVSHKHIYIYLYVLLY